MMLGELALMLAALRAWLRRQSRALWRNRLRHAARLTVYLVEGLALMAAGGVLTLVVLRAWS
ncbi:MAG: hypothetical protein RL375_2559 [Pseudomonadota bacterium]